ncbi:DUF421 domain-containing protein [Camelliibacillus cellulosilyticus]|uniref:DUF421 domain-containing protein n=1 Tax=Camelliibacillus cellulosilyticus TaxID=2174486 RepID=A0ABV9GKP7_9BACL
MAEYQLILLRSLFSFIFLLLICRLLGKQQISHLSFFDYIVGITIGSIAASLSVNQNVKITNGVAGLLVWGGLSILLSFLAMKSRVFSNIVAGKPTILIEDGKVNEKNLRKSKLTLGQLMLNLRDKNAFKISDVELAVFETNGQISVMKKNELDPVTPKLLGMQIEKEKRPYVLIQDGKVVDKALESSGYTKEWLFGEIQKQGANDFTDVFVAQVDTKGNLYVDFYDDQIQPPENSTRQIVRAQLKKVKADLMMYALDTENKDAKAVYQQQSQAIEQLEKRVGPYLI